MRTTPKTNLVNGLENEIANLVRGVIIWQMELAQLRTKHASERDYAPSATPTFAGLEVSR
jgi:hypothetical protein